MLRFKSESRVSALVAVIAFIMPIAAFAAADETVGTVPVDPLSPETQEAIAANTSSTNLDVLEVTGSRIKRADYESAQPVLSINREAIEKTGLTSIGDLLQNLSEAGSALNTTVNNGGNGSTEVDLRNLGSQRSLVLVNGHRWVNGLRPNSSSSVDLNTIPISIIERVEVLKDGASAVYGSDAVAGVINIITRKNFQGVEIRSQTGGFVQEQDGFSQQNSISFGNVAGATSTFLDVSYTLQEPVLAGNRDISQLPLRGTGNTRGSSGTPQGRFVFFPNVADPDAANGTNACRADGFCNLTLSNGAAGTNEGDFRGFTNADRYNYAPLNYLATPNERASIFGSVNHDFGDVLFGTPVGFSGEFLYNVRKSQQQLAETPLFIGDLSGNPPNDTTFVAADNPFNPWGQDIGRNNDAGTPDPADDFGSGLIGRRLTEAGPRIFDQNVDTFRFGGSFKGSFDLLERFVSWESGAIYAESQQSQKLQGLVNVQNLRFGLGPIATCNNVPGCVPVNLFGGQGVNGGGTITGNMLNYLTYTGQDSTQTKQSVIYAYLSNDLFSLPAGVVSAAYGLEFRHDSFEDSPDPLVQQGFSSNNRAKPTKGSQTAKEGYLELSVPLVSGMFLVDSLDLSLAGRYSDYSRFGSNSTYKIGARWKPYQDLLIRGTASTAFRAPSVSELFLGASDSFPEAADPCSDYTGANGGTPADATVQANCTADGIPTTYTQLNSQVLEVQGGNDKLTPEQADTFTFGFVFSPEFIPEFNFYTDFYSIELTDAIESLSSQEVLNNCYLTASRRNCNQISRNNGTINQISNILFNIGKVEVQGIDFAADYTLPWFKDFGVFKAGFNSSYLLKYDESFPDATGALVTTELAGTNDGQRPNAFPEFRGNADLGWSQGPMRASWTLRYLGEQTEACFDGLGPSLTAQGLCSEPDADPSKSKNTLEGTFYNDVQFGYNFEAFKLDISGGINNLFDQEPPFSTSAFANSYDVNTYDIPGMLGYLRLKKSF
ncbi:MAG: TonB-dependent receptor [Pseudomonadota bacterium]